MREIGGSDCWADKALVVEEDVVVLVGVKVEGGKCVVWVGAG